MGICRFCGNEGQGESFDSWVKPTFTDHDKLLPGEIICNDCAFWFEESSTELARITGKDKPQRMRNYSHFVKGGVWTPLSKGDKARMAELLLSPPFPELAVIADGGKKHIIFRATHNPPGGSAGWVQFEEQRLWVDPLQLKVAIKTIENALPVFSKAELLSGDYDRNRIVTYGFSDWLELEKLLKPIRGTVFFNLTIFLAQKGEKEIGHKRIEPETGPDLAGGPENIGDREGGGDPATANPQRIQQLSLGL